MNDLIHTLRAMLRDPQQRASLVAASQEREQGILELGLLDVDIQRYQCEGRLDEAKAVRRDVRRLEEEAGLR